jgi:hypothetical protein
MDVTSFNSEERASLAPLSPLPVRSKQVKLFRCHTLHIIVQFTLELTIITKKVPKDYNLMTLTI